MQKRRQNQHVRRHWRFHRPWRSHLHQNHSSNSCHRYSQHIGENQDGKQERRLCSGNQPYTGHRLDDRSRKQGGYYYIGHQSDKHHRLENHREGHRFYQRYTRCRQVGHHAIGAQGSRCCHRTQRSNLSQGCKQGHKPQGSLSPWYRSQRRYQ